MGRVTKQTWTAIVSAVLFVGLAALIAISKSHRGLAASDPAHADSALATLLEARRVWEEVRAVPRLSLIHI